MVAAQTSIGKGAERVEAAEVRFGSKADVAA